MEMTWRLVKKKGVFKGKHLGKNYGNGESAGAIGRHREQKLTAVWGGLQMEMGRLCCESSSWSSSTKLCVMRQSLHL